MCSAIADPTVAREALHGPFSFVSREPPQRAELVRAAARYCALLAIEHSRRINCAKVCQILRRFQSHIARRDAPRLISRAARRNEPEIEGQIPAAKSAAHTWRCQQT